MMTHLLFLRLSVDVVCYTTVLKACVQSTALHVGRDIHAQLEARGDGMAQEPAIQMRLMQLYAKAGLLDECRQIFDAMPHRDAAAWNSMVSAYAGNGDLEAARRCLADMRDGGLEADAKTCTDLMRCCSHCGEVEEARRMWEHELPDEEVKWNHYVLTSLTDGYARKGWLQMAYALLLECDAKGKADETMWTSLLNGCNKYREADLAKAAFEKMKERFGENSPKLSAASVLLSNIFAQSAVQK